LEFVVVLQQVRSSLKIHLTDTLYWDMPFPSDTTADVYIVCGFGEFLNESMLHRFDNELADRKLILLTSQYYNPCNLKNFQIFNMIFLEKILFVNGLCPPVDQGKAPVIVDTQKPSVIQSFKSFDSDSPKDIDLFSNAHSTEARQVRIETIIDHAGPFNPHLRLRR
jgi:hypothetical protein